MEKHVSYAHRWPRRIAVEIRSKSGWTATRRTAKTEESPEIWAKPAPHCSRLHEKLEELYRSHGSDMIRLVTAVKNAYLSRQSLSEPKNTNIPVQLYPYIPFQHRKSPTARSTPATGLLKLGNRGPREHTRLRTLRVLEKQPKSCPITARCPGKNTKNK